MEEGLSNVNNLYIEGEEGGGDVEEEEDGEA